MIPIRRILKDYADAGAVNSLIALWGFIDDATVMTKAGALGQVFRLAGRDVECLDHEERRAVTQRFEQALRQLDETFRVYQYAIKRLARPIESERQHHSVVDAAIQRRTAFLNSKADSLFEIELYVVILYEGTKRGSGAGRSVVTADQLASLRERLSFTKLTVKMAADILSATAHLHQKAEAFSTQLHDVLHPVLLRKHEAFRFFRQLLNYEPYKAESAALKYDTHLDFYVADSAIDCFSDRLEVDGYRVKVLTMKEPPAKTFAGMLHDLNRVPCSFIACLEWQRVRNDVIRRQIHAHRRHFFNKRISLVNYLNTETKSEDMLVDESATATVRELGAALTEMDVNGQHFGAASFTIVTFDRGPARLRTAVAELIKTFAGHDGALYEESYNLLNAWLAVVPGNSAHNLRRLALLNTNLADLSLLFTFHPGSRRSAHLDGREYLAVFETEHHTPYFWNLHYQDVGHTLIQGATGSGKSFLMNFIVAHAQKYDPFTCIFDLGGSYENLVRKLGGSTWKAGLTQLFKINPFCLPPTKENLHFLFSFSRLLLQSGNQFETSLEDDRNLYEAVENIYALDPPQRRLFTLANLLPRALAQHLHRWIRGGPYAELFDNADDSLTFQRIQCFDFEGLEKIPAVLEPLLFYVLFRASTAIQDRASATELKLFVVDEAWRFANDKTLKAYLTEALKTWRKRNAALLLATQNTEDFTDRDFLRTVIESCPTRFLLSNPASDLESSRTLFQLNHTEAAMLNRLHPRRQALLKRPDVARVIDLHVEAESRDLYSGKSADS